MSLVTSTRFASILTSGRDWREVAKKALESLESVNTSGNRFNLAFIYVTRELAEDLESILNLFRSVTGIEHCTGTAAAAVCGNGQAVSGEPGMSVMVTHMDPDMFQLFGAENEDDDASLEKWLNTKESMTTLIHGGGEKDEGLTPALNTLYHTAGGFIIGGLAGNGEAYPRIAQDVIRQGFSGMSLAREVPVVTSRTLGSQPFGDFHTITRCRDTIIMELDGRTAFDVFTDDLHLLAETKIGTEMPAERADAAGADTPVPGEGREQGLPEAMTDLLTGDVMLAFPIAGHDQFDYDMHKISGIDPDKGWIGLDKHIEEGMRVRFLHRDDESVRKGLARMLVDLRTRVIKDYGTFQPKGALYISSADRRNVDYDKHESDMALIRDVTGDVPLAGFYTQAEIFNHTLFRHNAILTLFL